VSGASVAHIRIAELPIAVAVAVRFGDPVVVQLATISISVILVSHCLATESRLLSPVLYVARGVSMPTNAAR
jgi:hypothetical protein